VARVPAPRRHGAGAPGLGAQLHGSSGWRAAGSGQSHEPVGIKIEFTGVQRRVEAAGAPRVQQEVDELHEPVGVLPLVVGEAEGGHGPGDYAGPDHLWSRQEAEHLVEDVHPEGADAVHPARHG